MSRKTKKRALLMERDALKRERDALLAEQDRAWESHQRLVALIADLLEKLDDNNTAHTRKMAEYRKKTRGLERSVRLWQYSYVLLLAAAAAISILRGAIS